MDNRKNNIEHVWTVVCEKSILDTETNNMSLVNTLEQLNVDSAKLPTPSSITLDDKVTLEQKVAIPIPLSIVTLWKRTDSADEKELAIDARITLLNPKDVRVPILDQVLNFKPKTRRVRSNIKIGGIPWDGYGEYRFEISLKEPGETKYRKVTSIPIEVLEKPTK